MILRPCPVSVREFSATDGVLVAEMSSLGRSLGRVWDDSIDQGLTVIYDNGKEQVFAESGEQRDREQELVYIELRPATNPQAGPVIHLYND